MAQTTVAYLTMAYKRMFNMEAVKNAELQNYPDHLKTLHLLYQEPYPNPIQHSKPFKIIESNVYGTWPHLWAFKLDAFLQIVTADVMIWFDEDDRFESDYTLKGLKALECGDIAWNTETEFIMRDRIEMRQFLLGSGTMFIRIPVFRELWDKFRKQHPSTSIRPAPDKHYPIDGPFFFVWGNDPRCVVHSGVRSYFLHGDSAGGHSWDPAVLLESHPDTQPINLSPFKGDISDILNKATRR